jgi:hypothetical protein
MYIKKRKKNMNGRQISWTAAEDAGFCFGHWICFEFEFQVSRFRAFKNLE